MSAQQQYPSKNYHGDVAVVKEKYGKAKVPEEHYELPSIETLKEAGELMIKDEYGKETPFKSLYEGKGGQRLIIFIRHFFCGSCEDYIKTLSEELPPAFLHASTPPTHLTIIGCGDIAPIPSYRTRTMHSLTSADTHFPMFCDPSRKLYAKLGMMSNMSTGNEAPKYIKKGMVATVTDSIKNAALSGTAALKGGNPAQNGGEMLFANGELVWFKRMRHTQDHAEIDELKEVLGLQ